MPSSQAKTLMTAQKYLQYFCKLAQLQVITTEERCSLTSLFSWLSVFVFCWTTAVWLPRRCATAHHTFLSAAQWSFYNVHMFKHHFVVSLSKVWGAHMRSRNTFRVIVSMFCSKSTIFFFKMPHIPHSDWLVSHHKGLSCILDFTLSMYCTNRRLSIGQCARWSDWRINIEVK